MQLDSRDDLHLTYHAKLALMRGSETRDCVYCDCHLDVVGGFGLELSVFNSWRITRASPNGIPSRALRSFGAMFGFSASITVETYLLWYLYMTKAWTVSIRRGQRGDFTYSSGPDDTVLDPR